jgi:uncharacterized phage-like protein YoqJ
MQSLQRRLILEPTTKPMLLGITGHRPHKLGGYNDATNRSKAIKLVLKQCFLQAKPTYIISGMALGVDQWAVEVALELGITVMALIPCLAQDSKWPPASRIKYINLLDKITENNGIIEYVTKEPYSSTCMHLRNQRIIEYSTHILAVWDKSWGGTGGCVRMAKQAGRPLTVVHPVSLEITYDV